MIADQRASADADSDSPAELVGCWLALDFANTVHDYRIPEDRDDLGSYADLVAWSLRTELIDEAAAEKLVNRARREPEAAAEVLRAAKDYRQTIYDVFAATALDKSPAAEDLGRLNRALQDAKAHAQLVEQPAGFDWEWIADGEELDGMLWPIIGSAGDLLVSGELAQARECSGDDCTWLFIDSSKNHSRRWCRMAACGNRAKARRHYSRKQGAGQVQA